MAGREGGDLCPECGTPFDRRPDHPKAAFLAKRGLTYIISAMVCLLLLPPIAFVFLFLSIRAQGRLKAGHPDYRIPFRVAQRLRLTKALTYAWFAEFAIFLWIDELWPGFMDWVGYFA